MPKISPEGLIPDNEPSAELERKATAIAPANIALIKYWGNLEGNFPYSDTVSFNLSNCTTTTTVSWLSEAPINKNDLVNINGEVVSGRQFLRASTHLDKIRETLGIEDRARVISENNFPTGAGIASSASGFSALTLAAIAATGLELGNEKLSALARLGSGSACRSIPDGFVLWHKGDGESHESSFAESIYPPTWWDLRDFVVMVEKGEKKVSSADGHKSAQTSPLFEGRIKERVPQRLAAVLEALRNKDIELLGKTIEDEARELHMVAMTSRPPLEYTTLETWNIANDILPRWRKDGIPAYFTLDAGPNVHIIFEGKHEEYVRLRLKQDLPNYEYIENRPCEGARVVQSNLQ